MMLIEWLLPGQGRKAGGAGQGHEETRLTGHWARLGLTGIKTKRLQPRRHVGRLEKSRAPRPEAPAIEFIQLDQTQRGSERRGKHLEFSGVWRACRGHRRLILA